MYVCTYTHTCSHNVFTWLLLSSHSSSQLLQNCLLSVFLSWAMSLRTYVCTYVRTYVHTYVCMYIRTYIHTYVCICTKRSCSTFTMLRSGQHGSCKCITLSWLCPPNQYSTYVCYTCTCVYVPYKHSTPWFFHKSYSIYSWGIGNVHTYVQMCMHMIYMVQLLYSMK